MKRYKPLLVKSCLDLILWYDMWKWQLGVCLFVLSKRFPCVSAAWNKGHNLPTKRFIFQTNKKPPHFLLQIRQEVRFMLGKCLKHGIVLKFNWNDYKAFTVKSSLWLRNHTKYIFLGFLWNDRRYWFHKTGSTWRKILFLCIYQDYWEY